MPKSKIYKRKLDFIALISRATGEMISTSAIKYLWDDNTLRNKVYGLVMPITGRLEEFIVPNRIYYTKTIPAVISDLGDYFINTTKLIEIARDYPDMAFNDDLSPLSTEECWIFGVREMQPNDCITRKRRRAHKDLY